MKAVGMNGQKWWLVGLAGALLLYWAANDRNRLKGHVEALSERVAVAERETATRLEMVEKELVKRDGVPEWMSVPETSVSADSQCRNSTATVRWSFKEWQAGTRAVLQFRRTEEQQWQEIVPEDLGSQSYQAVIPLGADPAVDWSIQVDSGGPAGASVPRTVYWPGDRPRPASIQFAHRGQYRIVRTNGESNEASAPQPLLLGRVQPVLGWIRVARNGADYRVSVYVPGNQAPACAQVMDARVRAYAGDRLLGEYPADEANPAISSLTARWTSSEAVSRLEVVVTHPGTESEIPVQLEP